MAAIQTSQTQFGANEQITSAKLNNILLQSSFAAGAVTTDGTLTLVSGQMQVGTLKTANFPTDGITTAKIADAQITPAKLSQYAPSWSAGTVSLQGGVELQPDRTVDGASYIDFHSSFPVIDFDARILRNSGVNGTMEIQQLGTGSMNFTSSSGGFKFGTAPMPTPSGTAPLYAARAFANFNGGSNSGAFAGGVTTIARTAGSTTCTATCANNHNLLTGHVLYLSATGIATALYTITKTGDKTFTFTTAASTLITSNALTFYLKPITGSGNISCITYNGTGLYWINLLTEMANSNYSVLGTGPRWAYNSTRSTVAFDFASQNGSGNGQDYDSLNFAVFA